MIEQITDIKEKQSIARSVLEALTEWFEVEESRENYIKECSLQPRKRGSQQDSCA